MSIGESNDEQPTVLVVDDEPATADLYAEFLAAEYTVRTAYSGEGALEGLDADVDVVLLDRRMPGITGDEVLREIREKPLDCRVIMVTALDPGLDILDLPFDDYLTKPVSKEQLRDAVSAMLARAAADEQIQEIIALASKMATLESKLTIEQLEASDEYAATETRFAELRAGTDMEESPDDVYAEFTTEKIRSFFHDV